MIKMAIWNFTENDAHGVSIGKTLPEKPSQQKMQQKSHADRGWEHIKLFLKDKVKITEKQS